MNENNTNWKTPQDYKAVSPDPERMVKVPMSLLNDTYSFGRHVWPLINHLHDEFGRELIDRIDAVLEEKFDAIYKHDAFTKYKTSTGEEREAARKKYVRISNIPIENRTEDEIPYKSITPKDEVAED